MYFTHICRPRDPLESVVSNGANVSAQLERCSPRSDISSELPYPFHSNGLGGGRFDRAQADIHLVGEPVEVIRGRVYARHAREMLNSMPQEFDRLARSVGLRRVWPKLPGGVCLEALRKAKVIDTAALLVFPIARRLSEYPVHGLPGGSLWNMGANNISTASVLTLNCRARTHAASALLSAARARLILARIAAPSARQT